MWELPEFASIEALVRAAALADDHAIAADLSDRTAALDDLARLERFNGEYLPTLSHLWAISRSVVLATVVKDGVYEYNWSRAFDMLAVRRPQLRADLSSLRELRPYYDHLHGRTMAEGCR